MSGLSIEQLFQLIRKHVRGRIAWAIGLGVPIMILFMVDWATIVTLILYGLTGIALVAAVGCGILAWNETVPRDRRTWIGSGGVSVLFGWVIWSCLPIDSQHQSTEVLRVPTLQTEDPAMINSVRYWNSMRETIENVQGFDKVMDKTQPENAESVRLVFDMTAAAYSSYAEQISQLPVVHVDPAIVGFARDYIQLLRESASLVSQFRILADEMQAQHTYANSTEVGVESFMRGLLGDPLGKASELNQQGRLLEGRSQELSRRARELNDQESALGTTELVLRSELTARYKIEFERIRID